MSNENYFTSNPRLFTVNDPKNVISVVQVNKMLLYCELVTNVA